MGKVGTQTVHPRRASRLLSRHWEPCCGDGSERGLRCIPNWQPGGQSWAGAMSFLGFLPTGQTGAGSLKTVGQVRRSRTPHCLAPHPAAQTMSLES